jgi:hypothetical protein
VTKVPLDFHRRVCVWTVWLHRGTESLIVAIGLTRTYADDLAEAMTNMIQSRD